MYACCFFFFSYVTVSAAVKDNKGMQPYFGHVTLLFIYTGGVGSLAVGDIWLMDNFYLTYEGRFIAFLKSTVLVTYRLTIKRL